MTADPKHSNLETTLTHRKEQFWIFVILYQDIFIGKDIRRVTWRVNKWSVWQLNM